MKLQCGKHTGLLGLISLLLFLLGNVSSFGQAVDLRKDIKSILEVYDTEFLSSFYLELNATMPTHFDMEHGRCSATVILTGNENGKYLRLDKNSLDPIKYDHANLYNSYDKQGNFVVNYEKGISIDLEAKDWRIRRDNESVAINSSDQIVSAPLMTSPRLEIFPTGHHDAANLFYRYILGLGRGYSQLIDEVTSASLDTQGITTVRASGSLFSPHGGTWILEIDTRADYLVRKATFTVAGGSAPTLIAQSSTYHEALIPLYEKGTVALSDYVINIELKNYTEIFDEQKARKVKARVTYEKQTATTDSQLAVAGAQTVTADAPAAEDLLPKGATIMNFSSIDSDGMPLMQKVAQ